MPRARRGAGDERQELSEARIQQLPCPEVNGRRRSTPSEWLLYFSGLCYWRRLYDRRLRAARGMKCRARYWEKRVLRDLVG